MKLAKKSATFSLVALLLSGCVTDGMENIKQTAGTLGGAILGGVAGSQFGGGRGRLVATGAGTLLGALIGNEIGASLDKADRTYLTTAATKAQTAPIGQRIAWRNPGSRNQGWVPPIRDGYSTQGSYCREYQSTIVIGGRTQEGHGTACQEPDGTWRIAGS